MSPSAESQCLRWFGCFTVLAGFVYIPLTQVSFCWEGKESKVSCKIHKQTQISLLCSHLHHQLMWEEVKIWRNHLLTRTLFSALAACLSKFARMHAPHNMLAERFRRSKVVRSLRLFALLCFRRVQSSSVHGWPQARRLIFYKFTCRFTHIPQNETKEIVCANNTLTIRISRNVDGVYARFEL